MHEKIVILDFGSQTTQLIGRRVRELNTYCEIVPYNKFPFGDASVKGVILSGSPFSVNDDHAFRADLSEIRGKYPVLGICYGAQLMALTSGGAVGKTDTREYGRAHLRVKEDRDPLLGNLPTNSQVWMSHGDTIERVPGNFRVIASTEDVTLAAYRVDGEMTWGVQFHPEVFHTEQGTKILDNFLTITGIKRDWTPASFIATTLEELKEQLGDDKVILALSGGVDSSVTAVLLNRAIGENLTCIFVDHGLLRKNEFETVLDNYAHLGLHVIGVDAKEHFYAALEGVTDAEEKRKIIGKGFIDVFEKEARKLQNIKWLAQGTIYPDRIESLSITGTTIKSHHNVRSPLIEKKREAGRVIEPLDRLYKDEVRALGRVLGLPQEIVGRHPFPGPGLGVRILGDITKEKCDILREADSIYIDELRRRSLYDRIWQAFCVLLPVRSVGVTGDERAYKYVVALRAIQSEDGMTAQPYAFDAKDLFEISAAITNRVPQIGRVVYDVSSKPPATIEWE